MFTDGNHKAGWAIAYRLTSLKTKSRCSCTLKPKSSQLTPATTQVFRTLAFPSYSPPLPMISVPCAVHSPSSSHFLISILLLISLRASLTPGVCWFSYGIYAHGHTIKILVYGIIRAALQTRIGVYYIPLQMQKQQWN
ncbi:unnamed protein product [Prunus armeniaca]|uniref:Uncharacterized protein n=1 Tax=Prunus armeniaca TaxID=36596 RepID=A0A6J5VJV6_PRUAR|nr:unnamed protein product [Prunus armeniaca]